VREKNWSAGWASEEATQQGEAEDSVPRPSGVGQFVRRLSARVSGWALRGRYRTSRSLARGKIGGWESLQEGCEEEAFQAEVQGNFPDLQPSAIALHPRGYAGFYYFETVEVWRFSVLHSEVEPRLNWKGGGRWRLSLSRVGSCIEAAQLVNCHWAWLDFLGWDLSP
jgi:hypothetical protein